MRNLWIECLNVHPSLIAEWQLWGRTNRYNSLTSSHKTATVLYSVTNLRWLCIVVLISIQVITEHFKVYVHCTQSTIQVFFIKGVYIPASSPHKTSLMLFRLPHSKKEGFVSSPVKSVSLLTTRSSNTNLTDNRFESLRWQDDLHLYIVRQWNSWLYLWTVLCMYIYFVIDAITCTVAPFVFFQVWETWLFHPCIYKLSKDLWFIFYHICGWFYGLNAVSAEFWLPWWHSRIPTGSLGVITSTYRFLENKWQLSNTKQT